MPTVILFVLAALALWGVARLSRRLATDGTAMSVASPQQAVGVAAAVLICGLWLGGSMHTITALVHPGSENYEQVPGLDTQGGGTTGVAEADMLVAEHTIPSTDRMYVALTPSTLEDTTVWLYTRLAPRVPVKTVGEADWIIFTKGTAPTDSAYASLHFDRTVPLSSVTLAHLAGKP